MKTEVLTLDRAAELGRQMPNALIRTAESVFLGDTPVEFDLNSVTEARFFDGTAEIRVFIRNCVHTAVRIETEAGDPCMTECRLIENVENGKKLAVKKLLSFDEDGQAFVAETMLCGWEE